MKNFIKSVLIIILTINAINTIQAQHEEVDNILIGESEGIRFYVVDSLGNFTDTSKIKCHPAGVHNGVGGHPIFLEFRPGYLKDSNRVVIYESGLMGIGVEDPCLRYDQDIAQFDGSGVKLLLQTGKALRVDGLTEWDIPSDIRLKKEVNAFDDGLNIIKKINPISYKYNGKGGTNNDVKAIGISAQEMEKVAPYTVRKKPSSQGEYYTFNGSALRYVIINAIKELDTENILLKEKVLEQSQEVDDLKNAIKALGTENILLKEKVLEQSQEIDDLKEAISNINKRFDQYLSNNENVNYKRAGFMNMEEEHFTKSSNELLQQNKPNPFSEVTKVSYTLLPETETAQLMIFGEMGHVLNIFDLDVSVRSGTITINLKEMGLQKGKYFYSLFLNDELVSTKKMIFKE